MPLDLDVVRAIRVNRSAVERRAATIPTRRTVKKEWQAAWLLRAITLIDLTTLSGDDTPGNVRRLCAKARHPLRDDLAAVTRRVDNSESRSARCASTTRSCRPRSRRSPDRAFRWPRCRPDFRPGLSPIEQRIEEIRASVAAGARGDRHRHHARARAHRQLRGAVRRGAPLPRGLRRRAHEGDSRHRRAGDARQRRAREHGRDAGGRRFHQDVDRQGRRERDDSVRRRDVPHDSRVLRADRLSPSASSRPAAFAPPRTRSSICI